MSKFIILIVLIVASVNLSAQFKATYYGYVTEDGGDFYIAEIPGKTSHELFSSVNAFILKNFKNPDAVSNKAEGEMINLHGVFPEAVPCKKWFGTHYTHVDLNLVIYFKDERIRFDIPTINDMTCYSLTPNGSPSKWYLHNFFNKNGKIKNEDAAKGLDKFINDFIANMINYANEQSNKDW